MPSSCRARHSALGPWSGSQHASHARSPSTPTAPLNYLTLTCSSVCGSDRWTRCCPLPSTSPNSPPPLDPRLMALSLTTETLSRVPQVIKVHLLNVSRELWFELKKSNSRTNLFLSITKIFCKLLINNNLIVSIIDIKRACLCLIHLIKNFCSFKIASNRSNDLGLKN